MPEITPKIFGYVGTLPFLALMLLSFFVRGEDTLAALNFVQAGYASLVLSFLAGAHWGQAIPVSQSPQYRVAVAFVGILFLAFIATVIFRNTSVPMIIYAALFWAMYFLDQKFMPLEYIDQGYFDHRKKITTIVSVSLILSAL